MLPPTSQQLSVTETEGYDNDTAAFRHEAPSSEIYRIPYRL